MSDGTKLTVVERLRSNSLFKVILVAFPNLLEWKIFMW